MGHDVTVLTVNAKGYNKQVIDWELLNNCPDSLNIVRTAIEPIKKWDRLFNSYYLNIADRTYIKWKKYVVERIKRIVSEQDFDHIVVTVPPFSLVGLLQVLPKLSKASITLDMRDAWSQWNVSPYASKWHYIRTVRSERKALECANRVVVTSEQTKLDLIKTHPTINQNKVAVITNAYTGQVIKIPEEINVQTPTGRPLKIGYIGSFYYTPQQREQMFKKWWKKKPYQYFQYTPRKEDWLYRSPYYFFKTLAALQHRSKNIETSIQLNFAGNKPFWFDNMADAFGISHIIKHHGRISQEESMNLQASCDLLLITSAKVLGGRDYSIAGKTFEYIQQIKPILSFVTAGAQKDLLGKSGLSIWCNPDDIETSADILESLLKGKITLYPNEKFIRSLHISEISKSLLDTLEKI